MIQQSMEVPLIVGMMVIALMCGGDGLADIIGRKYGSAKLPFNRTKSWAGSLQVCATALRHRS